MKSCNKRDEAFLNDGFFSSYRIVSVDLCWSSSTALVSNDAYLS